MKELKEEIQAIAGKELDRANIQFPLFNSSHEGYAVLLEELEETEEALNLLKEYVNELWQSIKANKYSRNCNLSILYDQSINTACEAVQVIAMIQKLELSSVMDQ